MLIGVLVLSLATGWHGRCSLELLAGQMRRAHLLSVVERGVFGFSTLNKNDYRAALRS
jgi:hypothetical protein